MVRVVWNKLRTLVDSAPRRTVRIGALAAVSGLLEAIVLVGVVAVAAGVASADASDTVELPVVGPGQPVGTILGLSAVLTVVLLLLNALVSERTAALAADTLHSARSQALTAFSRATWSAQSTERDGSLQHSLAVLSLQTSDLSIHMSVGVAALLSLCVLIVAALVVDALATLLVILSGAVLFAIVRPIGRVTQRRSSRFVKVNGSFSEDIANVAASAMELRLFAVEPIVLERLDGESRSVAQDFRRMRFAGRLGSTLYRDLATTFLVIAVAGLYLADNVVVAEVGAVVLLIVRGLAYASIVQSAVQQLNEQAPSLLELCERIDRLRRSAEGWGSAEPDALGDIALVDVSYSYPSGTRALDEFNLVIHPGEAVGIAGPSGAGKSTLLQVLLRLRSPTSGTVTVAGLPYGSISAAAWARLVALVPQEPRLLEASVMENIRFMRAEISEADVRDAARAAHVLDELLRLPQGLETTLGPRGTGLSGGQKQRVAIARALAGRPRLLVLDEPTSALDSTSELRIRETISGLKGEVTMVIVAHRASTLDACDRVVTLTTNPLSGAPG